MSKTPSERFPIPELHLGSYTHVLHAGADYTTEEREFMMAVDWYKRRYHRPHLTWREVLHIAHFMGYRKLVEEPGEIVNNDADNEPGRVPQP